MPCPRAFRPLLPVCSLLALLSLSGCDLLGIEGASAVAAKRDAEGRAVGAGCRQGARSVEQCYDLNKRSEKAAVFAGWRDMNDYMRENKLESMPSLPDPGSAVAASSEAGDATETRGPSGDKADQADKADKGNKPEKNRH